MDTQTRTRVYTLKYSIWFIYESAFSDVSLLRVQFHPVYVVLCVVSPKGRSCQPLGRNMVVRLEKSAIVLLEITQHRNYNVNIGNFISRLISGKVCIQFHLNFF